MIDYKPGDVILVPYPFGERAGGKKRPAVVVSNGAYNQETGELMIAQITSRATAPSRPGDYEIQDWRGTNLPRAAMVRARLATIDAKLVLRRLGQIPESEFRAVQEALGSMIGWES